MDRAPHRPARAGAQSVPHKAAPWPQEGPLKVLPRSGKQCGLGALPRPRSAARCAPVNEARFPSSAPRTPLPLPPATRAPFPSHPCTPVPGDACWGLTDARQLVSPSPCFSLP